MDFNPEALYGQEPTRRLKIEIGPPADGWLRKLIVPFQEENASGIVYFPKKTKVVINPLPTNSQLWQIIPCDSEYNPVGSIILSTEKEESAVAEFSSQNKDRILEIMAQIRGYPTEESVTVFSRNVKPEEIRLLQEHCRSVLGYGYYAHLFSVDNFSQAASLQPAYQDTQIYQTDSGPFFIICNETQNGPHQKPREVTLIFAISPPRLPKTKAVFAVDDHGLFSIDPVFIERDKPLMWSIARGYLEKYQLQTLDHLHFIRLQRVLDLSWQVGSENAEEINPKARELLEELGIAS